jgi:hypothetical protein
LISHRASPREQITILRLGKLLFPELGWSRFDSLRPSGSI